MYAAIIGSAVSGAASSSDGSSGLKDVVGHLLDPAGIFSGKNSSSDSSSDLQDKMDSLMEMIQELLSQLESSGSDSGDACDTTGAADGASTTVNGGSGDDVINIGAPPHERSWTEMSC